MSGLLDTSLLIRYFTDDPPGSAAQAAHVVDGIEDLLLPDVVVAETGYVLTSNYRMPRAEVVDRLIGLLQKENIRPMGLDRTLAIEAMELCRSSRRVSFADALTWAAAHESGVRVVYTWDRRFPSDGIEVRRG